MTNEQIEEIAKNNGITFGVRKQDVWEEVQDAGGKSKMVRKKQDELTPFGMNLFAFARAVAAAEREECAKICDKLDSQYVAFKSSAAECAKLIRTRA